MRTTTTTPHTLQTLALIALLASLSACDVFVPPREAFTAPDTEADAEMDTPDSATDASPDTSDPADAPTDTPDATPDTPDSAIDTTPDTPDAPPDTPDTATDTSPDTSDPADAPSDTPDAPQDTQADSEDVTPDTSDPTDTPDTTTPDVPTPDTWVDPCATACDDGNPCTTNSCDPTLGCQYPPVADTSPCTDNDDVCTLGDTCQSGACVPGPKPDADKDGYIPTACGGNDCDDTSAAIHPGADEWCDDATVDDNCDGTTDATTCVCPTFWLPVASDNGSTCAPNAPIWGNRGGDASGYMQTGSDGTWTDIQAGLQWSTDVGPNRNATTSATWCLTRTTGGFTDWRQPTLAELSTLMTTQGLQLMVPQLYGQSYDTIRAAAYADNTARGWTMSTGAFTFLASPDPGAALCVRSSAQPKPATSSVSARFVVGTDGQLDTWTGLTWVNTLDATMVTYAQSVAECAALTTGGQAWRVPSLTEMLSQVNSAAGFPASWGNIPFISDNYWTSDKRPNGDRWVVYMGFGAPGPVAVTNTAFAQCVSGPRACGSVVDCGDGNDCTDDSCDPATHVCAWTPTADGTACDDGNACTMSEVCASGQCRGGVPTDGDGDTYVAVACGGKDCDDTNQAIHPDQSDLCDENTVDDNCDGTTDGADCTCKGFYWPVIADVGRVCAPDGPVWGQRPLDLTTSIVDNGDSTATDSTTSLQWHLVNPGPLTFDDAVTFCQTSTLGGHTDWRLPTMTELSTLFDPTQTPFRIAAVFQSSTVGGDYWSAWGNGTYNKLVSFTNDNYGAGVGTAVRCVRGGPSVKLTPRFTYDSDVVYDLFTGTTWQRHPDLSTTHTWDEATAYCDSLTAGGFAWRLPTFAEFVGLVSFGAGASEINAAFPDGLGNGAWTSTVASDDSTKAGYVAAYFGFVGLGNKSTPQLAICVH